MMFYGRTKCSLRRTFPSSGVLGIIRVEHRDYGNGAALNLRYFSTRPDVPNPDWRYVPIVLATGRATLVETLGFYNAEHEATFEYDSIGGRKYRSTISLNRHVITALNFGQIK
jgi:hypothetical protein